MTAGATSGVIGKGVEMYDIERDVWSVLPNRKYDVGHREGICLDGKLYLLFTLNDEGPMKGITLIEKFDIQAHIEGKTVHWEDIILPPEQLSLLGFHMVPISNTEIASLRFKYKPLMHGSKQMRRM